MMKASIFLVGLLCFLAACSSQGDSEMEILEGQALYDDLIGTWQLDYLSETYRDAIFDNRTEAPMTCTFFEDRTLLLKDSLNRIFIDDVKLDVFITESLDQMLTISEPSSLQIGEEVESSVRFWEVTRGVDQQIWRANQSFFNSDGVRVEFRYVWTLTR